MISQWYGLVWFAVSLVVLLFLVVRRGIQSIRSHRSIPMLIAVGVLGVGLSGGCVGVAEDLKRLFNPDKSTPGNHLAWRGGGIDLNEKTDLEMTGFKSGRTGWGQGYVHADYVKLSQSGATWDGVHGMADRHIIEQDRYWRGINDVMDRVPPIINAVAPITTTWINSAGNVALQRALRPTLIQQLAGGITGGLITPELITGVFGLLDPNLAKDAAGAATKIKATPPSGTQPTAAREWWPNTRIPAKTATAPDTLERFDRDAARAAFVRDEREIVGLGDETLLYRIR